MNSQVLSLCLNDWEHLLQHFPDSKEVIEKSLTRDDNSPDDKIEKGKKERRVTIFHDFKDSSEGNIQRSGKSKPFSNKKSKEATESQDQSSDDINRWPLNNRQSLVEQHLHTYEPSKEVPFAIKSSENISTVDRKKIESAVKLTDQDVLNEEEAAEELLARMEAVNDSTQENIDSLPSIGNITLNRDILNANLDVKQMKSVAVDRKKIESAVKLTDQDVLNEEEEAAEALLARMEAVNESTQENIDSLPSIGNITLNRDISNANLDVKQMKSVDEYILGRYGEYTSVTDSSKNIEEVTDATFDDPTSTSRLQQSMHVRYDEISVTKSSSIELHELKPMRDLTTDERNFKSLDSDIDPNTTNEDDNKSVITRLSEESDSDSSINKKRTSSQ
ncbi:unnamed protein product [Pieris brassicae]|uniref:Uncharacterized protein n=1 Tax=Pieris brassicae TaxID=7116 RepID=A0A9P0SJB2_PIEBR|nr:unnamed protein product [Pieris brassicae]